MSCLFGPQTSPPFPYKSISCWSEGESSLYWIMHFKEKKLHNQQAKCQALQCRNRTMQSLRHPESWPQPGLWNHRQGHLPGNLSCSDYTKILGCLWAILPFCSVKYERHSGKRQWKVWSPAYQFTTFEFTEPGTRILLYPGREPSLGAWTNKRQGKKGKM